MPTNTCLNCSASFTGKYCNNCGEKVYQPKDKKLAHIFEEIAHFLTHFDGTLVTSVKTIFKSPGRLSHDYCQGVRKRYFKPVSLYILLVVLYLVFPLFPGLNMPLRGYKSNVLSERIIEKKLAQKNISFEELEIKYNNKSEKVSKFMLLIVLPLCALLLAALFYRKKYFFFDHFILSAEINSLFLIAQFFLLPLILLMLSWIVATMGKTLNIADGLITPVAALIIGTFTFVAFRRFYNSGPVASVILGAIYAIGQLFIIFFVYRLLLFNTVMLFI